MSGNMILSSSMTSFIPIHYAKTHFPFTHLLIHISVLGQDDLTPRVVANQVCIEYGMHPDIVLEMVKGL